MCMFDFAHASTEDGGLIISILWLSLCTHDSQELHLLMYRALIGISTMLWMILYDMLTHWRCYVDITHCWNTDT